MFSKHVSHWPGFYGFRRKHKTYFQLYGFANRRRNLNLNATTNLRSLDGLQNLRRVGSNNITFGSPDLKDGAQFGKCGKITQTNNTTAYSIQHACFYDNYKWCQSMLIPNAYRCVSSIATKIIKNRNLRKFARILEISGELMRLQAIQKAITLFRPSMMHFCFFALL